MRMLMLVVGLCLAHAAPASANAPLLDADASVQTTCAQSEIRDLTLGSLPLGTQLGTSSPLRDPLPGSMCAAATQSLLPYPHPHASPAAPHSLRQHKIALCGTKFRVRSRSWHGMAWYGMAWHGMAWYGMAWHGMVWYGMV